MAQLNRLHSAKSHLNHLTKHREGSNRKARTRTLIQLGGLVNLSGLLDYCDIKLGTDLQLNNENKAATLLLGILIDLQNKLPSSKENMDKFISIGSKKLIMHEAKKYYSE